MERLARWLPRRPKKAKTSAFEHIPLDRTVYASRIVALHPGKDEDVIECSIKGLPISVVADPSDKSLIVSHYEALSYVWGDASDPQMIIVEGKPFNIGKNLWTALRHLRYDENYRLLWIDAICINQEDVLEKNWQVAQMGLIYRAAERVTVWLGEGTVDSKILFMLFDVLDVIERGEGYRITQDLKSMVLWVFGESEKCGALTDKNAAEEDLSFIWKEIDELPNMPWFHRVWVVQEFVLGQEVFMMMGDIAVPWKTLYQGCIRSVQVRESRGGESLLRNLARNSHFMSFSALRNDLRDEDHDITLLELANHFSGFESSDPRDKIYGFLGLSRQTLKTGTLGEHSFLPDYSKSVAEVYKEFALYCMQKYNNLDVFSMGQKKDYDFGEMCLEWPSWVPDWTGSGLRSVGFKDPLGSWHSRPRDFNTSGNTSVGFHELPGINILSLKGVIFDKIVEVVDYFFHDVNPRDQAPEFKGWREWHEFGTKESNSGDPYGSPDAREDAYWRTLVIDSDGNGNQADETIRRGYQLWQEGKKLGPDEEGGITIWSLIPPELQQDSDLDAFLRQMQRVVLGRKLFRTERGYLGIGTSLAHPGCSISILHGGKLPILSRDLGHVNFKGEHKEFNVLYQALIGGGDCYIHGLMDAEALGIIDKDQFENSEVFFG